MLRLGWWVIIGVLLLNSAHFILCAVCSGAMQSDDYGDYDAHTAHSSARGESGIQACSMWVTIC